MAESLLSLQQEGATHVGLEARTASFAAVAAAAGRKCMGYAAREAAGTATAAEWILRHGTSTAGTPFGYISLTENQCKDPVWFSVEGMAGVNVDAGVFAERIAGTIDLTIFFVNRP